MTRSLLPGLLLCLVACHSPGTEEPVPTWTLVEDIRIGGADTGAASLNVVAGLAFDPAGRIWVYDRQATEIRVFGGQGGSIRTVGRQGEGPGEIGAANGLAIDDRGLVWVFDHGNRRYVVFDTAGHQVAIHPNLIREYGFVWDGGIDADGRVYDRVHIRTDTSRIPAVRVFRDTSLLVADTLPVPPCESPGRDYYEVKIRNGISYPGIPFAPRAVEAVAPSGRRWCSSGATPSAFATDPRSADTAARLAFEMPAAEIPESTRTAMIAQVRDRLIKDGGVPPDFKDVPTHYPAVEQLSIDREDRIWVRVHSEGGTRFELFDRTGEHLASVTAALQISKYAPIAFRGDTVLAVTGSEEGVPYVVRFHLDRGTPLAR